MADMTVGSIYEQLSNPAAMNDIGLCKNLMAKVNRNYFCVLTNSVFMSHARESLHAFNAKLKSKVEFDCVFV